MVEMLIGLPGMRVLEVRDGDDELVVKVETTADRAFCPGCGVRAQAQDRTTKAVRDLSCFGRPVRLEVEQRRWRCREALCARKTWTEHVEALDTTAVLTRRAGAEVCRQVGEHARPVAQVAREFGVCWWTVMNATIEHGTPLVDDPERVGSRPSTSSTSTPTRISPRPRSRCFETARSSTTTNPSCCSATPAPARATC